MRQRRLREHVVRKPVGELRESVRGARRDEEQIGARQVEVDVVAGRAAGERPKGLGGDEALGSRRHERHDVVAVLDEQTADLAGLVGGNAPCDPKQDAGHRPNCAYFAGP